MNNIKNYSVRILSLRIIIISLFIGGLSILIYYFWNIYVSIIFFIAVTILSYYLIKQLIYKLFVNKIAKIIHTAETVKIDKNNPEPYLSDVEYKALKIIESNKNEIKLLKSKEKFRREFLGNISHELKTPIFSIQGYILTLIDGGLYDKNINIKYLNLAERNINRLIEIINDLDKITKLETGEIDIKHTVFDITELIFNIIESLEYKAKKRNQELILETKNKFMVFADKYQITTVISNLIRNSINYGKDNGTTTINIYEKNNLINISIKDDGIGISPKDINKIFERFYRVDKSRSRDFGGSGLGLSIVKHIIEAHNQQIKVYSKINEGSNFIFTLEKAK